MRRRPPSLAVWLIRRAVGRDAADAIIGDLTEELRLSGSRTRFAVHACSVAIRFTAMRFRARTRPGRERQSLPERMPRRMESLILDVKFAARSLAKRPSFAVVVLATLALGIGAATAIFSVVDGILLRPLPFVEPGRLVFMNETDGGIRGPFAWPNFVDLRDRATSFASMACHVGAAFTVVSDGPPRRLPGRLVTAAFFDVLGVRMQTGRTFTASDDAPGATPVAIVSDRFWREELGGGSTVAERTFRTSDTTYTIVGVLPPGFRFFRAEDVFIPLGLSLTPGSIYLDRGNHNGLVGVARLKAGVSLSQADAEVKRIAADLAREYPATNARSSAEAVLLRDRFVASVRDTLVALMGAVGFLMLLACVNVANLLVARGASRQHELAIRTALGGTRWRLIRQLLAESTVLSLAGGLLGIVVAGWLIQLLIALAPEDIPRLEGVALNRHSLAFAFLGSAACGLFFGAFPALQASRSHGLHILGSVGRTSGSVSQRRTRRALMALETALALILLAGCGLMARTMVSLNAVDPGFRPDHVLSGRVVLAGPAWDDPARRAAFHQALIEQVARIPGVTAAGLTLSLPIEGSNWGSIFIARDKPVPPRAELPAAAFVPVSAGYFATMGIQLREGRAFDVKDTDTAQRVTIVNETFARRMWPGEDPVGKQIKQGWPENTGDQHPWREVVGVVNDVKLEGVDRDTPMQAFLPLTQAPSRSVAIVVRTAGDPEPLAKPLEAAVQALGKELPVVGVQPMTRLMSDAVARQRLSTVILGIFAIVAIVLAAVGLYGVVAHSVTERTREIGVRMALGAKQSQVLQLFVAHGLSTAIVGTIVGVAGALMLSRWLEGLLFGVEPTDPATFAGVAALLLIVAAAACYLPARRAARTDPLQALRCD